MRAKDEGKESPDSQGKTKRGEQAEEIGETHLKRARHRKQRRTRIGVTSGNKRKGNFTDFWGEKDMKSLIGKGKEDLLRHNLKSRFQQMSAT